MTRYVAVADNCGVFLTKDVQFDDFLSKGYSIYAIEGNELETLIATPEAGFFKERPILQEKYTMTL